jgi:hypothetical protein
MKDLKYVRISYDGLLLDIKGFIAKDNKLAIHKAKLHYSHLFGSDYANKCKYSIV